MTELAAMTGFSQEAFDEFIASRDEPQWLLDQRRHSWQAFCEMQWPERRSEEWMRTDIRLFNLARFAMPGQVGDTTPPPRALLAEGVELAGQATTINSQPTAERLDPKWAERGVLFGSLDRLLVEHGDKLRPYLMTKAFNSRYDRFAALHAACFSGGSVLYVPRNVVVDEPLHALCAMSDGGIDLSHTLVVLEEGAEATLLSEMASPTQEAGGLHCGAVELLVGPRARLRYVNLQAWGHGVWHFAHQRAIVDRDASLQWTLAAMGSKLAKVNQQVELAGPGAESQVNGVLFAEGKQHVSYHTAQHHSAPSCRSDFLYKSALQDKARTVWRGMIQVDKQAQKTDGYQRNDNLLLSNKARADSIPGLEILADDVRCTHGSTSGRVDEEMIFYAMARGFTREEAVQMIVTGFFQQIFDRITIESVREALALAIARRVRAYE